MITALIVTSAVCLAFAGTRHYGVLGIALLTCFYPLSSLALLILGGVFVCCIRSYLRRK